MPTPPSAEKIAKLQARGSPVRAVAGSVKGAADAVTGAGLVATGSWIAEEGRKRTAHPASGTDTLPTSAGNLLLGNGFVKPHPAAGDWSGLVSSKVAILRRFEMDLVRERPAGLALALAFWGWPVLRERAEVVGCHCAFRSARYN